MTKLELLNLGNVYREEAITTLIDFCNENGLEKMTDNFIRTDYLDELVKNKLEEGSWKGVACMLAKIDYLNDKYYYMDKHGNMREIDQDDIECVIVDIISYHEDILEDEEEN